MSISKVEKRGSDRTFRRRRGNPDCWPAMGSLDYHPFSDATRRSSDSRSCAGDTVCWVLALAFAGSTDVLLFLAPALLLVAPLVAGRYVGETLITKLAARRFGPRRRPSAPRISTPPAATLWLPRGTRLLACSLAKRPPPLRLLVTT
jgi:hypothetical protein